VNVIKWSIVDNTTGVSKRGGRRPWNRWPCLWTPWSGAGLSARLARSAEYDDPLRLRHAPHALARSVVLNTQVNGFGIVTQQCGGCLELRKAFDSGALR
jgi:hypothetical protein